jgi:hypothetical protein
MVDRRPPTWQARYFRLVIVTDWVPPGDFLVSLLVALGLSISGELRHRVAS